MTTMPVGELKSRFSEVLERVRKGEKIVISLGRKKTNVAVIVPYEEAGASHAIRLGSLHGKAKVRFSPNFDVTPEDLLGK